MSLTNFWNYKKTNFVAGGLRPSRILKTAQNTIVKNPKFIAPRKLDFRDMCIMTSNQGSFPQCAAYSTAGFIELKNWKLLHYPEQVDANEIYKASKILDGDNKEGTSLDNAAQSAINLGLISGTVEFVDNTIDDIKFTIHTNNAFMGGFLITNEWNYVNKINGQIYNYGNKASTIGGHAVLVCGYDEIGIYIQNSWGPEWGIWGFALIPWELALSQFMYGVVIV